jgi:hypothetical protein
MGTHGEAVKTFPASRKSAGPHSSRTPQLAMTICSRGLSIGPVLVASIFFTTSNPSTTSPNTTCLRSCTASVSPSLLHPCTKYLACSAGTYACEGPHHEDMRREGRPRYSCLPPLLVGSSPVVDRMAVVLEHNHHHHQGVLVYIPICLTIKRDLLKPQKRAHALRQAFMSTTEMQPDILSGRCRAAPRVHTSNRFPALYTHSRNTA